MVEPVILPDRIRALRPFRVGGQYVAAGEVIVVSDESGVPWEKAKWLIARGDAEPVIEREPFEPEPPAEGWSLAEAYKAHVLKHPRVVELSEVTDCVPIEPPSWLCVQDYGEQPQWRWPTVGRGRRVVGVGRRLLGDRGGRLNEGAGDSVNIAPPLRREPFDPNVYNKTYWRYLRHATIHDFLGRFERGELVVDGTGESPSDLTLDRECLPRDWWRRGELRIGFQAKALFRVPAGGKKPELFLSDVRVRRGEGVADEAAPPTPERVGEAPRPSTRRVGGVYLYNLVRAEALDQGWTLENLKKKHGKRAEIARALYIQFDSQYEVSSILTVLRRVLKEIDLENKPKANSKPN